MGICIFMYVKQVWYLRPHRWRVCVLHCKSRIAVQFTFLFQEKRINTCIMNIMLKRKRLVFTTIDSESMVFISKLVWHSMLLIHKRLLAISYIQFIMSDKFAFLFLEWNCWVNVCMLYVQLTLTKNAKFWILIKWSVD